MPQLKMHGEGRPDVSGTDVFSELKDYPWSDWPEGNIIEVIRYLRGNVDLDMPSEWKACFPSKLWCPPKNAPRNLRIYINEKPPTKNPKDLNLFTTNDIDLFRDFRGIYQKWGFL